MGVSLAKTLAFALGFPAVGVPRLLADALRWLPRYETVAAVHRAGRKDVALAIYAKGPHPLEVLAPRLIALEEMVDLLSEVKAVVGEVPPELVADLRARGLTVVSGLGGQRRPLDVARLGLSAVQAGADGDPQSLLPVYLRPAVVDPSAGV